MNKYNAQFFGKVWYKLNKVDSTNNFLRKCLETEEIAEGTTVMAYHQTAGKGQRGNSWQDEPGSNIAMSVLLKTNFLPISDQFFLSVVIALGTAEALESAIQQKIVVKWPNDIYFEDQKLGGILIENNSLGKYLNESIVGIGINVNQLIFAPNLPNPISLKIITGLNYDLEDLVLRMLFFLEQRYMQLKNGNFQQLKNDYLNRLYCFNQKVLFEVKGIEKEGKIIGVASNGQLIVDFNGSKSHFDIKEIKFLKALV